MTDSNDQWDVIIIGAGAAGLMAAASAGRRGKRVLLLEKNKKIGVKILMSGGTRCNITHNCGIQGIIDGFGRQGKFLHSALAALPPAEVVALIESRGVTTKAESTGKIFPISNKAIDVRDALVELATDAGVRIETEAAVQQIRREDEIFSVDSSVGNFQSRSIVITTGGKSYPGCGTTGDGYGWAIEFGHSIVTTFPALVPILSNCQWAHDLKGITVESVTVQVRQDPAAELSNATASQEVSLADKNLAGNAGGKSKSKKSGKPKILSQRTASFLFTHWGFSGPSVLDVSREVASHRDRKSLQLVCDFLPTQSAEHLLNQLNQRKTTDGKQSVSNLLNDFFPKRLSESLLVAAGIDLTVRNAEISKKQLAALVQQIKGAPFPISGTLGFEKAEVTSGGVSLKEVDSKTMQSKLVERLYFAGEILDLDGRIGGFNFQSAFSTGWLAGQWA